MIGFEVSVRDKYTFVNPSSNLGESSSIDNRQAPFKRITEKQSDFIMSKYLPHGLKLLDPRAMRQEDIVKFFKHISTRQISHGVRDAFRFKAVMTSRK